MRFAVKNKQNMESDEFNFHIFRNLINEPQNKIYKDSTHLFNFSCKLIQKCPRHSLTYSLMCCMQVYELYVILMLKLNFYRTFFCSSLFPFARQNDSKPIKNAKMILYCVVCFMWENESTAVQIILLLYFMNKLKCILFALVFPLQLNRSVSNVLTTKSTFCVLLDSLDHSVFELNVNDAQPNSLYRNKKCFFLDMINHKKSLQLEFLSCIDSSHAFRIRVDGESIHW